MERYVRVDQHQDLIRDRETGAILNINIDEIKKRRQQKALIKQQSQEMQKLKNEVDELKSLLKQLLEKNTNG